MWPFKWNLLSSTFLWCCLFFAFCKRRFHYFFLSFDRALWSSATGVERRVIMINNYIYWLTRQSNSVIKEVHSSERVHIISAATKCWAFLIMAQYFAALLVLCLSVGSLGTTTKPQQQNTSASKDLCQVSTKLYYFVKIRRIWHGSELIVYFSFYGSW